MRKVNKGQPPADAIRSGNWQQARLDLAEELAAIEQAEQKTQRARTAFDDQVVRPDARLALEHEQQSLCEFCEQSIESNPRYDAQGQTQRAFIRVAHWVPLKLRPDAALTWTNLFGSCSSFDSCDCHQEDAEPRIETPAERDWSHSLLFSEDGRGVPSPAADQSFRTAIGNGTNQERGVWNLNAPSLVAARREAIRTELEQSRRARDRRRVGKAVVVEERLRQLEREPLPFHSAVTQALSRWSAST
jgi:hypothetical protein